MRTLIKSDRSRSSFGLLDLLILPSQRLRLLSNSSCHPTSQQNGTGTQARAFGNGGQYLPVAPVCRRQNHAGASSAYHPHYSPLIIAFACSSCRASVAPCKRAYPTAQPCSTCQPIPPPTFRTNQKLTPCFPRAASAGRSEAFAPILHGGVNVRTARSASPHQRVVIVAVRSTNQITWAAPRCIARTNLGTKKQPSCCCRRITSHSRSLLTRPHRFVSVRGRCHRRQQGSCTPLSRTSIDLLLTTFPSLLQFGRLPRDMKALAPPPMSSLHHLSQHAVPERTGSPTSGLSSCPSCPPGAPLDVSAALSSPRATGNKLSVSFFLCHSAASGHSHCFRSGLQTRTSRGHDACSGKA